jgi:NADP-dependent 3-hydroxy acid dehydrogenase YdfG
MHFKDKVAIVTGGSSGIGKKVAHGASVVIGGRDESKLQAAAEEPCWSALRCSRSHSLPGLRSKLLD